MNFIREKKNILLRHFHCSAVVKASPQLFVPQMSFKNERPSCKTGRATRTLAHCVFHYQVVQTQKHCHTCFILVYSHFFFFYSLIVCRYGFRIAEPSGGKRRTQRKVRVDPRTTHTPPPAAGSPWTRRRSPAESWTGWRRRSGSRSGGCSSPRTGSLMGIYFTPRGRTATAGCRM